jgi:hypothetical protein
MSGMCQHGASCPDAVTYASSPRLEQGDTAMNRAMVAFGLLAVIVGVGIGHLMYTHPEGLNPAWPLWMALLAPALFVLGGLHVIAAGLDQPRLSNAMIRAILVCFWAILHWAAFFTAHFQCRATLSFLGVEIGGWQLSETECRYSLRAFVAILDALVVLVIGAFVWHRYRAPERLPAEGRAEKD